MDKILVLHNAISDHSLMDELDVLDQADAVEQALDELGYSHSRASFGLNLEPVRQILEAESPDLVFNLVETIGGKGSLIHLCPSLLEAYHIPYTGSGPWSLLVTTDKVRTKKILKEKGVATPGWIIPQDNQEPVPDQKYILKPVWEDGSAGITDESIIHGKDFNYQQYSRDKKTKEYMLEEFIEGREFNITMLHGEDSPVVMPPAEMLYRDFPPGKPKILNYASKWDTGSFEYHNTIRSFELREGDRDLVGKLVQISQECWDIFEMRGYMRVDFRVDGQMQPYVIEVNANPCLSPDAGFPAACAKGGIEYTEMIHWIVKNAL